MASRENGRIGNNRVPNKDHFCVEKSHLEGDSRTYVATAWFVEGNRADADIRKLTKAGEKEYIEDVGRYLELFAKTFEQPEKSVAKSTPRLNLAYFF